MGGVGARRPREFPGKMRALLTIEARAPRRKLSFTGA